MKKAVLTSRKWIVMTWALGLLVLLLVGCSSGQGKQDPALNIDGLSTTQRENLYVLGKVWGLAKYHHPVFATEEKDWDQELLEQLLPQVLQTADRAETDTLLTNWIVGLGQVSQGPPPFESMDVNGIHYTVHNTLEPSLAWLYDDTISAELSQALTPLLTTYIEDRSKGPAVINQQGLFHFNHENAYKNMNFDDDGLRLLALFRYWNVIEYYFPYKDLIGEDWNTVLAEFIPRMIEGDELSYVQTLAELTTRIHDSHVNISDSNGLLVRSWGSRGAPLRFSTVDGQVVITRKPAEATQLHIGDVVTEINGVEIQAVIAEKLTYISLSRDDAFDSKLAYPLFRSDLDKMKLTVQRDGETFEAKISCGYDGIPPDKTLPSHELLEGNIGLINPGYLKKGELDAIMETFQDTRGLIVDLRQYPSDPIVYTLANHIMPSPATFANLSFPDVAVPGRFQMMEPSVFVCGGENPDYYTAPVVILINGNSMSQPEFTAMSLRQAPNATVIGSPSNGADGNVVSLVLPGNVVTSFSGLGVYTPEGGQTQRIGVQPDIFCYPTIEGIAQGRDELLEKAIQHIQSDAD